MKRIGMLTSGGDCQALNAAMRGVVKTLANGKEEVEIYGFLDGYRGLIYSNFRMLTDKDFSGILTKGGTILGTSRTPFKTIQDPDPNGLNKVEAMKQNYYKLQLDCLVILGGNGTHKTANLLRKEALADAGLAVPDIDLFVLHQANARIIDAVAKRLHADREKFPTNLERVGNLSSASIPVLLDELHRQGKLHRGDRIVLAGFGAGLTIGACVMTW